MPEPATGPLTAAAVRIDKQQAETAAHMARGLAELMRDRQRAYGRLTAWDGLAFFAGGGMTAAGIVIGRLLLCR